MKNKLSPLEWKWVLYDVGNSAFILLVASVLPIYFNHLSSQAGVSESDYLSAWSYATSISTVCVAILAPIMGTIADFKGNKKKVFLFNAISGAAILFCFWIPKFWAAFLLLYVLTKIFYSVSLVVYDSMLVDVTNDQNMDMVSSKGYAYGYIGSCIPFVISLVFILIYDQIGMSFSTAMMITFTINAAWWILCTLPLGRSYKQKYYVETETHVVSHTFQRLIHTFKNISHHRKAFMFLLAFFFYIDGVYTIIDMATAYGTSLGLNQTSLLLALLVTQVVAFPSAIAFDILAKKYSAAALIKVGIIAYFCIAVYAIFLENTVQFWILAVAVGLFQGGIQALSRSYFARLIPENASGEYFGIFDICGKGASFLGTMVIGVVTQVTGHQNLAVGCLALLFLIGFILFSRVCKMPNDQFDLTEE